MSKSHQLKLTLEQEGIISGEIICPYDGAIDAPCAIHDWNAEHEWVAVGGCFVQDHFDNVGMELWEGTLELPVIDIDYRVEGDGPDTYLAAVMTVRP